MRLPPYYFLFNTQGVSTWIKTQKNLKTIGKIIIPPWFLAVCRNISFKHKWWLYLFFSCVNRALTANLTWFLRLGVGRIQHTSNIWYTGDLLCPILSLQRSNVQRKDCTHCNLRFFVSWSQVCFLILGKYPPKDFYTVWEAIYTKALWLFQRWALMYQTHRRHRHCLCRSAL